MKKTSWLPLIAVLFCISSCQFGNPLTQLWFYTYSGTTPSVDGDTALTPASFLELRPDGSYSRDFGQFDYGTWTRKDQTLILTDNHHKTSSLQLGQLSSKEMQLTLASGLVGHFDGFALPAPDKPLDDPFSLANNAWRIRATHKENDTELRHRLYNHCQFWAAYFNWALQNNFATVDVRSTPTAIKIYGNGFGLKPFQELPAAWKSCFFDDDDCRRSNDLIEMIFQHKNIAWAHTDSKYKMFLSAFQQMEGFLR